MRRKVFIRADASKAIGYGHFIRSTALAAMLREHFDVTIFTASPNEFQLREAEGICHVEGLPSDPDSFPLFLDRLEGGETVILDNYFYTDYHIECIRRKGCRTVLIQDFFGKDSCADAMILPCRNPRWALLREPFLKTSDKKEKDLWTVAIGATDPLGLTQKFSDLLRRKGKNVRTLSGDMSAAQVARLFSLSEGVVCSASSVCYEALACGCRVCAGWYVDNQKDFYSVLCSRKLILPLGDLREAVLPEDFEQGPANVSLKDSFRMAQKNCTALIRALGMEIVDYTRLTPEQSRKVWEVRNREDICRYMTNPNPFPFEEHCAFIESLKSRKDKLYLAFFKDGEFAGSIDLVGIIPGESAERGLYVNPHMQGQSIGTQMECIIESTASRLGLGILRAEVLSDNTRSLAFHKALGYEPAGCKDGMIYLQKEL